MENHYFDASHPIRPYTHSLPAMPGTVAPANALRGDAPEMTPGFWPCEFEGAWRNVEDHRQSQGQGGTPFWMPGDTHGSPVRYMKDLGPLPAGALLAPPPLPFEEPRAAKVAEINGGYESVMAYIQAGYPLQEVLSWERQAVQARELQANPEAAAPFVRTLAAVKGFSAEEMAGRILANAESWEPVAAMLTAQRQLLEERVWMATTTAGVEAITVAYSV